jgi:hypothetical protein
MGDSYRFVALVSINALAMIDSLLARSRLGGTDVHDPIWITSGLPQLHCATLEEQSTWLNHFRPGWPGGLGAGNLQQRQLGFYPR